MAGGFELVRRAGSIGEWRHPGNGLTALVAPTPVAPVAGLGVVYRVGSRFEGTGHTGATHILEHLMFKGTARFNRTRGTEVARELHRVGAVFNATTWFDRTNYYEVLPVAHLPLAVDIEADRMRGALVRDEDLESERTVVLNELDSGDNEPFELLMKGSFAHAFLEHPYRHPTIGWRGDVRQMSAEVLRRFYDTYYHPDNATVIVVGAVDEAEALAAVAEGFSKIPPKGAPFPTPQVCEEPQRGERRFNIHRAGELPCLAMTWRVPRGLDSDLPALSVLTQILGDGVTSRLSQRLVETNLCLGVHAFVLELHDPGVFQIFATVAPEVEPAQVEEVIRGELASLRQSPPAADEVARAKVQTRTDIAFHHESPGQVLGALTEAVAMGEWRRFVDELELVEAVTAEDLKRVAETHLHDRNLTVGWFLPDRPGPASQVAAVPPTPQPCYLDRAFAERTAIRDLPGGGRLAVVDNPHAPTVTVAGTLRAGPALAPDGRYAVPVMTAAMLDRGTSHHDRLQLARALEDHGLQLSVRASTASPTVISFTGQGLAEEVERLIALMTEVLRRPSFPEDELEKLRRRVLGSLVHEREDTSARAYAALTRHLYPQGHPLRRRPIEDREREVESVSRDELAAFHAAAYGSQRLAVAVVGDVAADRVGALVEDAVADWPPAALDVAPWPDGLQPEPVSERIQIEDRPSLDVFLGHCGHLRRGDDDYAAAVLGNACLGQSTLTSRLGVSVREEAGLTYGISSRFFGTLEVAGPWAVNLGVAPDNLDRAVELSRAVIGDYVVDGPNEGELADERSALAGAYRVGLATNAGIARELVTALTAGEPVSRLDDFPEQVLAATRDEVVAAIRRHLHPDRLVLTAAGDFSNHD